MRTDLTAPDAMANHDHAFLAKVDAAGNLGSFSAVTDHAGGRFAGQNSVVTETDDGVIVWWRDGRDGNAWVSLRDTAGCNEVGAARPARC